jgi:hypothetical protein
MVNSSEMLPLPIKKILRFVLVITVSLWMAGAGCLLGCSNEAQASSLNLQSSTETIVAKESCASSSHHCCAKNKSRQTSSAKPVDPRLQHQLLALPTPVSEKCPLAVNASAVSVKVGAELSKAPLTRAVETPEVDTRPVSRTYFGFNKPHLLNRGPTHLRCCVFLI